MELNYYTDAVTGVDKHVNPLTGDGIPLSIGYAKLSGGVENAR